MRWRDLFLGAVFMLAAGSHFTLQWYAWQVHRFEVVPPFALLAPPDDYLWRLASLPLLTLIPNWIQHLYFSEMLLANSALWGLAAVWCAAQLARRLWRPRKRSLAHGKLEVEIGVRTKADRLVELKKLRDQDLISGEEYVRQRSTIVNDV